MFPTPTTSDWKGGSGTVKEKDGKYYRQSDKTGVKWGVKLDALIEYQYRTTFPTPTASDHRGAAKPESVKTWEKRGHNLPEAVQLDTVGKWPTPTTRDYKGMSGKGRQERKGNPKDTLPNAVGGQLNPTWVEWLMGFPIGWTDLNS
jgi:hypothetical protein